MKTKRGIMEHLDSGPSENQDSSETPTWITDGLAWMKEVGLLDPEKYAVEKGVQDEDRES